jgi:hypothetical protein
LFTFTIIKTANTLIGMEIEFSKHSVNQMRLRSIYSKIVELIIQNPDSIITQDYKTKIYSKLLVEESKTYLYRVFVNENKTPPMIITVYKTSKIEKYGYQV